MRIMMVRRESSHERCGKEQSKSAGGSGLKAHFRSKKIKMPRVAPPFGGGVGGEKDPSGVILARGFEKRKHLGGRQGTSVRQGRCSFIPTSRATSGARSRRTKGDLERAGNVSTGTPGEVCALPVWVC